MIRPSWKYLIVGVVLAAAHSRGLLLPHEPGCAVAHRPVAFVDVPIGRESQKRILDDLDAPVPGLDGPHRADHSREVPGLRRLPAADVEAPSAPPALLSRSGGLEEAREAVARTSARDHRRRQAPAVTRQRRQPSRGCSYAQGVGRHRPTRRAAGRRAPAIAVGSAETVAPSSTHCRSPQRCRDRYGAAAAVQSTPEHEVTVAPGASPLSPPQA